MTPERIDQGIPLLKHLNVSNHLGLLSLDAMPGCTFSGLVHHICHSLAELLLLISAFQDGAFLGLGWIS
jgi:hypothetical protein